MSILVIIKVPADTDKFRAFIEANAAQMEAVAERSRTMGGLHHVFSLGDNVITAADQWDSMASFEKFFSDPEIAEIMANAGATGPPQIEVYEVVDSLLAF